MTARLVLVSLGPVQDFIAQARRTRDLWFGSHLLSELSRAVARELVEEREGLKRAELIFPALARGDRELEPEDAPVREGTGRPPVNVANKILAELDADESVVRAAVKAARARANERLKSLAAKARANLDPALAHGADVDAVWNEQIETLLDFNAVWMSVADGGGYKSTRDALERALAARKNLRDFAPWNASREGVPKSSLDGARETVLARPDANSRAAVKARRRYRLGENEQLDAIGVTKRAGGEPDQFVPIARVALAGWITEARRRVPDRLDTLTDADEHRRFSARLGAEVTLLAALVSRPVHASGWDMEKGSPKRALRLVAPGAVYFFEKSDQKSSFSAAEVGSLWLAAIGRDTHQGLGRVIPGNWNL